MNKARKRTCKVDGVDEEHVHGDSICGGEGLLVVDGGEVPAGIIPGVRDLRTHVALAQVEIATTHGEANE